MEAFPSLKSVGDMLALGVNIEPEQEELVSAPAGRPMVAVWGLPDPQLESGQPFYLKGMPVVVPIVMQNCKPLEDAAVPWLHGATLFEVLAMREDPFETPTVVGEIDTFADHPYRTGDFELLDEHYGRRPWDLWPIESEDTIPFNVAVSRALDESGYLPLIDYIGWENGYDEPIDDAHQEYVEKRVLNDSGWLKDPEEFEFKLHLPPEHQYTWDRLIDLSQQGAQSYGMTLPPEERKRYFHPMNGETPWF